MKVILTILLLTLFYYLFPNFALAQTRCEFAQACKTDSGAAGQQSCVGEIQSNGSCQNSQGSLVCSSCQAGSAPTQPNPAPSFVPPAGNEIGAPSLNDDYTIITTMNKGLLPESVYTTPTTAAGTPTPVPVKIGVEQGFFQRLLGFLCGILALGFCPVNVNLAANQTDLFVNQSSVLVNSQRPPQVIPTPATKDAHLRDIQDTQGDKALNQLDTAIAKQGIYNSDLPDQVGTACNHPESVISKVPIANSGNLTLGGNTIPDDKRAPDINCNQELLYQSNYPQGIRPLAGN